MSNELVTLASTLPSVTMSKAVSVVHLVAAGETVTQACKLNFITVTGFRAACKREPDLQTMLDEAMAIRNDTLNDMLINIHLTHSDARMASVVSKNIQWVLERSEPEKFGARLTLNTENESSRLLAEALNEAIKRVPLPRQNGQTITDVTFVDAPKETPPVWGPAAPSLGSTDRQGDAPRLATLDELKALGLI